MNTFHFNPGSPDAVALGCVCPVAPNHEGLVPPMSDTGDWWLRSDCVVHQSWFRRTEGEVRRRARPAQRSAS